MQRQWIANAFALVLVALAGSAQARKHPAEDAKEKGSTPLQRSLKDKLEERSKGGQAGPASVDYEFEVAEDGPKHSKVIGRTTLHFDGPSQAGHGQQWPRLVVKKKHDQPGNPREGDFTDEYRAYAEEKLPGVWDQVEFGSEPRDYTFEETIDVAEPGVAPAPSALRALLSPQPLSMASAGSNLLMGFTYEGPHIDYSIKDSAKVCIKFLGCATIYSFRAGFTLDWAAGLRLPASAELVGPIGLVSGSSSPFTSTLTVQGIGENGEQGWSAGQYSNVGVSPESGNEFVLRMDFFIGLEGEVLGADLCPDCNISMSEDESKSFDTPLGDSPSFPIPGVTVPLADWDLDLASFSIGLEFVPDLRGRGISAAWQSFSGGDATKQGQVFHSAAAPVSFPVDACMKPRAPNGEYDPHQGLVRLSDYRYEFDGFSIGLNAFLDFHLFGFGVWHPSVDLGSIDLTDISGVGSSSLGRHQQCDAFFNCSEAGPGNLLEIPSLIVDSAPPTTQNAVSGLLGNNGWYRSDAQVSLQASDNPPACGIGVQSTRYSTDGVSLNSYGGPFMVTSEGVTNVSYQSDDYDGNAEPSRLLALSIDKTPPVLSGAPTTPSNANGWYRSDVVVHFTAFDAVSGVDTVTGDQILSAEGMGQSIQGNATDKAGNSSSTVVDGINIDKTAPSVSISSPASGVYPNTSSINVVWAASDALSGIASVTATLDGSAVANGQAIDLVLFPAGNHEVQLSAVDRADNAAGAAVSFFVNIDIDGLIAAKERVCQLGWIDPSGICNALDAMLANAKKAIQAGRPDNARTHLDSFMKLLDAQVDKAIQRRAYDILKGDALYVSAHL